MEAILKKPMAQASTRLQRMMLALRPYRTTVVFKPGKEIPVTDALSRLHGQEESEEMANLRKEIDLHVHAIVKSIPISDNKMAEIREATKEDRELLALQQTIKTGWPATRKRCRTTSPTIGATETSWQSLQALW